MSWFTGIPGVRRQLVWSTATLLVALAVSIGATEAPATPKTSATTYTHGYDVSWPQCAGSAARHMPASDAAFVILGLTDGAGHTVNPCLGSQAAWARSVGTKVGAYLVPTYPTRAQQAVAKLGIYGDCGTSVLCRLRNDGASQAAQAVGTMRGVGLGAPMVWLDVEFRSYLPWSHNRSRNAAVIQGAVRELRRIHEPFGVYTTAYMWRDIVGGYRLDVPNWLPVGHGGRGAAAGMCEQTATGGVTWLAQYTRSLDSDITCPVLDPVPGRHNKLWRFRRTTLRLFSQGDAVKAVQRIIGQTVNGSYGLLTSLAVRGWQASQGLPATGRITPPDWRAMGAFRVRGGHPFWLDRIVGTP